MYQMNQLRKAPRILAIVLAVMILLSGFQVTAQAQTDLNPIIIVFDASHSPQFSADDSVGLKMIIDLVNESTKYMVRINEAPLTDEVLNGVDILIIAAPDESSPFTANEISGISEMLANGSSLFLLGDPALGQQSTYWADTEMQDIGDNIAINRLLDGINMTGVRFSINTTAPYEWSDTMFDYDHALNETTSPWLFTLDPTTWDSTHPIFRNINELYTITATLKPIGLASGIGHGYESSFAQYQVSANGWANYSKPNITLEEYSLKPLSYSALNGTFPSWISAFEYGSSRIVILGSTIMFTGKTLDLANNELQYFYAGDNARFFMNIISWLSEDFAEIPSAIVPMLIISTVIMIVGVAFYLLKKIR
jgi:hypothetical protein